MRNRKTILLLFLAILAFAALDVYLYTGQRREKATERTTLIELSSEVVGLSIERQAGPATVLERTARRWQLTSPFAGGADDQTVLKLLDALSTTEVSDAVSDSDLLRLGRTLADFSLDAPVLRVTVSLSSGRKETVEFGAPTPAADGIYARIGGMAAIFIVPPKVLASADVSADGFRRRSLFLSGLDAVTSFDVRRPGESVLEFSREGDQWRLSKEVASEQKISKFLSDLTTTEATSFVWPTGASNETERASTALLAGKGLDPDSAVTVMLKDVSGASGRVTFGKETGDGLVYALVQDGEAIVTVPAALKDFAVQESVLFTDTRLFPVDARSTVFFSMAEEGVLYALSRGKGGSWSIESPISAPADQEIADAVLSRLLSLTFSDVVSSGGVSVSVSTNGEQKAVARASVLGDRSFEDLRSKEMLRVDPALVKRIVRQPGSGGKPSSVVYARDRRAWNVESEDEGRAADEKGVAAVLASVNPLKADRIVRLKVTAAELGQFGLDEPFLTVAIDQESDGAVRRNILIGKETKGGRFATVGSADAVFVLPGEAVRKLSSAIVEK